VNVVPIRVGMGARAYNGSGRSDGRYETPAAGAALFKCAQTKSYCLLLRLTEA
jgi:hypothetical protein